MKRFAIVAVSLLCIVAGVNLGQSIAASQDGYAHGRDLVTAVVLSAVALFMAVVVAVMRE